MHRKSDRAARYPFAANIELTDVRSERFLSVRTSNLSLFGCYVSTTAPFPVGTKVSLRILHGGATLAAFGQVVYSSEHSGMGSSSHRSKKAPKRFWRSGLRA